MTSSSSTPSSTPRGRRTTGLAEGDAADREPASLVGRPAGVFRLFGHDGGPRRALKPAHPPHDLDLDVGHRQSRLRVACEPDHGARTPPGRGTGTDARKEGVGGRRPQLKGLADPVVHHDAGLVHSNADGTQSRMIHTERVCAVRQPAHLEPAGLVRDGAERGVGRIGPGHERRRVIPVPKHDIRTAQRGAARAVSQDARHHAFSHLERDAAHERVGHRSAGLPIRHEHGPRTSREARGPNAPGVAPDRETQPPVPDVEGALRQAVEGEVRADKLTARTLRQRDVAVPDLYAAEFRALLVEPERALDIDEMPVVPRAERDAEHRFVIHLVAAEPEAVRVPELRRQQHVRVRRVEDR